MYRIDRFGGFNQSTYRNPIIRWIFTTIGFPSSMESQLYREVTTVQTLTKRKVEKLRIASDSHIGLELMHLFMLDLLGRDTPVARVFLSKSEQE